MVGLFQEVRTVVVVVVVDSLEQEFEEAYSDGDTGSGVRLRVDTGDGDGIRSISSLKLSSFAGVGGRFLTGLNEGAVQVSTGWNVFCFLNS